MILVRYEQVRVQNREFAIMIERNEMRARINSEMRYYFSSMK